MAVVHGHALCCQPLHITDKGEIAPMNLIRSLSLSQSPFFSFPFLHRKARKSLHLSPDCRSSRTSAWPRPLTSRAPRHASARRPPDARMSPVLFEASRSYSFPPRPPPATISQGAATFYGGERPQRAPVGRLPPTSSVIG